MRNFLRSYLSGYFEMFFFPLFSVFLLSKGQDPYAILGVSRGCTADEIKKAFRAKTHKFHPDKNKEPDAEKKWLQISDAYELLKDPKKREKFDKFGIIDETLQEKGNGPNRADRIKTILAQDSASRSMSKPHGEFDMNQNQEVVSVVNDDTFNALTRDGRPWVIYSYSDEYFYRQHKTMLEDLFQKTGFLFGIGRLKTISNPRTTKLLGINVEQSRSSPQIVLYDPTSNKTSFFPTTSTLSLKSITRFASQRFGAEVTLVKCDDDIVKWRKSNLDKLHVLLFSDLRDVPTSFETVAAFLKNNAIFAFASVNQRNLNNFPRALGSLSLDELPTYIIYRMGQPRDDTFGGPVTPIVAPMDLDAGSLSAIIRRFHYPVFAEINGRNFKRLSSDYCIIYVKGVEMAEDIKVGTNDMNIPTGSINLSIEKDYATAFKLEPGDFLIVRPRTKEYSIWKYVTTWGEFRKKYELMQHGVESYKRIQDFPNLTTPDDFTFVGIQQRVSEQFHEISSFLSIITEGALSFLNSLSLEYLLGLFAILMIFFGELLLCLFKPKKNPQKHID